MSKAKEQNKLPSSLDWVVRLTSLMDTAFRIQGTKYRFGIDAIIGLVPFLGEGITLLISGSMVVTMARYGASSEIIFRMLGNVLLDWIVGSVPLVGDLFDVAFKANRRNLELLRKHYEVGKYNRNVWPAVLLAIAGLIGLFVLALYGTFQLGGWLLGEIGIL